MQKTIKEKIKNTQRKELVRIDLGLGLFNPIKVRGKKIINELISSFETCGESHHSKNRELIGYVIKHCEDNKIAYCLTASPEFGYSIERIENKF